MPSKIPINMEYPECAFAVIDILADKETDALKELINDACNTWTEMATENIIAKLDNITEIDRHSLGAVIRHEILTAKFRPIFAQFVENPYPKKVDPCQKS